MKESTGEIQRLERDRREVMENVNISIGAACTEVSASASEILNQATDSSKVAATAVKEAEQATRSIKELIALADTINSVVKLITDLAEQTNILAINATIEAAHAGDRGRGFAVVATGVKHLSKDTKDATITISARVEAIHKGVSEVARAITTIAGSVNKLNNNAATINAGVNEQVIATEEITRRVAEMVTAMATDQSSSKSARKPGNGGSRKHDSAMELEPELAAH